MERSGIKFEMDKLMAELETSRFRLIIEMVGLRSILETNRPKPNVSFVKRKPMD